MLVPFVIDSESLAPDQAWSPTTTRACHHQLLHVWEQIGLLVHDGERFEVSNLNRAVEDLPQNLKTLWHAMLKRSPPVPCANSWNGTVVPDTIQNLCSVASLALVDDARAEVDFGIDEDQDEIALPPTEAEGLIVCRVLAAQNASVIKDALAISQRNIEPGECYSDIWSSRFHSLASASSRTLKKVSIVDRYTVGQHLRCPQQWLSGLERFLRLLDEDAGTARYVTVYSAWTADLADKKSNDVKTEMAAMMQKLQKTNVKRLTVHMVPNHAFGNYAHDRYIRFGRYVWELGRGLEIFEGPASRHFSHASFKSDTDSHLGVEQELEHRTEPNPIKIHK